MLVIAEKASVARTIRSAIKPSPSVIALRGHILELDFPERYSKWRSVNPRDLFKAPIEWIVRDSEAYRDLANALKRSEMLILATDNDPEGELIAYEALLVAERVLGKIPMYARMRFNAATPNELRQAWENFELDLKWNWVWKALFRHKFDLITGAAYTRLLTLSRSLNTSDNVISWGSCVKGDTIIPGDYKPILEINVGDRCIGFIFSDNRVIKKFVREYSGQLIRIKGLGLLPIELTPEHPVLIASISNRPLRGNCIPDLTWKSAEFITSEDSYLFIPRVKGTIEVKEISLEKFTNEENKTVLHLNRDIAWLLGAYIAGGYSSSNYIRVRINANIERSLSRLIKVIRMLKVSSFNIQRHKDPIIDVLIYSEMLSKALTAWCGDKAENKRIPEFILLHKDLGIIRAFLEGYKAGSENRAKHNHKENFNIYMTTKSKVLAMQLQLLYARLGCFLHIYARHDNGENNRVTYIMRINPRLKNARFHVLDGYILTPIINVRKITYSGLVYNLETSDNTYLVSNIVVHNCQMPTLWFIYQREMEIRNFKPEKYYVISAILNVHGAKIKVSSNPIKNLSEAQRNYAAAKNAKYAILIDFQVKDETEHKPLPTDTDTMLQELSKIMGLSATKIMALAETLYGDGYISYPRTETNMWLSVDHKSILNMLSSTPLGRYINVFSFNPRDGRKNDGAHPPIYPAAYYPALDVKGEIWEYISRRYLANTIGRDALLRRWKINVKLNDVQMNSTGRYFLDEGFYQIFPYFKPKDLTYIPNLSAGEKLPVIKVNLEERETKPPPRLTESELLKLLEKHSIGTDATRADYPQIIVDRGYAEKRRKTFYISSLGETLINLLKDVDERLVTPDTRRYVEQLMADVEMGRISIERALEEALKIYEILFDKVSIKLKEMERHRATLGIK
ncbi:MAG: DNA topoisomerase [Candidatus Bathyarchaeia archaeon]